ncbi:uncharacterized protein LOC117782329 [Drosophila innubila]|uniref:uncharacterized protein LOC117782329 n=1 Tax=Drosophila innubila TaxID=198719 RepID=UPI00148E7FE7|nr:uncharacterized protein LOC117782329 [Drosophila innubila]
MGIFRNEKYPGKCVITPHLLLDEGVSIKDPTHECRQIVCGFNGSAVFQSCGIVSGLPASCRFGDYANVELPYPHCCEREVICTQFKFDKSRRLREIHTLF